MDAWIQHGGGQQLWDELGAGFNIKPLPCGNSGVQAGGWYTREINTLEDFKGLKIRMPGLGGEVMRRLGAAAVTLPGGEIFQSLQTGAIDATEWVGPWNDLAFGFYRAAKYYYLPGFHEPGTMLGLGINLDLWRSLSTSEKAIFQTAAQAQNMDSFAEFNTNNARALRTLIEDHGVELRTFSDEIFRELGRVSHEVLEDIAGEDDLTQRVYQSYLIARANGMEWGPRSDEGYTRVRRLYTPSE
jgi:TRAP-type mannitol/chloroaromatic compound transport system substrate-binding protein